MKRGIVSGFFNPLHWGHLDYIHAAREQCDDLTVIVNNDLQVNLKGSKPFMTVEHRCAIINALRDVDKTIMAIDSDKTVCETLKAIKDFFPEDELIFFNSGDRATTESADSAEIELCRNIGIKYIAIPLQKRYSSSTLKASIA